MANSLQDITNAWGSWKTVAPSQENFPHDSLPGRKIIRVERKLGIWYQGQ